MNAQRFAIAFALGLLGGVVAGAFNSRKRRSLDGAERPHIKWTPYQIRALQDNKGAAFVKMRPDQFLHLTIPQATIEEWEKVVEDELQPLDRYNQWVLDRKIRIGPFLKVKEGTGEVIGHEGRHRALALKRAGGREMLVGIILADKHGYGQRGKTAKDLPPFFRGEYLPITETYSQRFEIDQVLEAAEKHYGLLGPAKRR